MKIKLLNGISVRTGPDRPDGTMPSRRLGKGPVKDDQGNVIKDGEIIDVSDVPEWKGEVPEWLIEQGHVELIDDGGRKKQTKPRTETVAEPAKIEEK